MPISADAGREYTSLSRFENVEKHALVANIQFFLSKCIKHALVMITQAFHERTSVSPREGFKHAFVVHKLSRFKCVVGQAGADMNT